MISKTSSNFLPSPAKASNVGTGQHVQRINCNWHLRWGQRRIHVAVVLDDHEQAVPPAFVAGPKSIPDFGIDCTQRVRLVRTPRNRWWDKRAIFPRDSLTQIAQEF